MSRDTIQRFLESLPPDCLRVFDINFRQQFYDLTLVQQSLQFADVLKLSDEELPVLASALGLSGSNMTIVKALMKQYVFTPDCADSREKRHHLSLKRPS